MKITIQTLTDLGYTAQGHGDQIAIYDHGMQRWYAYCLAECETLVEMHTSGEEDCYSRWCEVADREEIRETPVEDRIWVLLRPEVLGEQFAPVMFAIADRAVRNHCLDCELEAWAERWLSREDCSGDAARAVREAARDSGDAAWDAWSAAWAAGDAARTARAARAAGDYARAARAAAWAADRAAWAAGEAAWAAWGAGDAGDARAARAAAWAADRAAWGARTARAAWGAGDADRAAARAAREAERRLQLRDIVAALRRLEELGLA